MRQGLFICAYTPTLPPLRNRLLRLDLSIAENFASIWSPLIRGGRKAGISFYQQ